MNFTIESQTSSSDIISIDPLWGFSESRTKFQANGETLNGYYYNYLFGIRDLFYSSYRYMQDSNAQLINDFWKNNEKLTLVIDVNTYTVYIANPEQPFRSLSPPYQDMFDGEILFREAD